MSNNNVKKIYLCRPNLSPICQLNGVETDSVTIDKHVKDFDQLSFTVDRFINIDGKLVESSGYELLNVAMYLHVQDYGYFRMEYPTLRNDGTKETKEITAYSSEKEVFNIDWVGLKINTAEEDSQEMLIDGNVTGYAMPINLISFHNPYDERFSLLNILILKAPLWSVGYVDPYLYTKTDDDGNFIQETKKSQTGQDIPQYYTSSGRWVYTDEGTFEYEQEERTEPKYQLKSVGIYDEDNVSIYAFLTSTLGPKVGALFFFDTEKRLIHAVSKYSLEHHDAKFDTGIFIGFRNLANNVDLSVDEDSVVTRVNCEGGDGITFRDINYGSSRLIDLSYFAHEPYMTEETAQKVLAWQTLIEEKRAEYKELAIEAVRINDEIHDITYKVPADENYWKTWDGMNEQALNKSLAYYLNEIAILQESVDTDPRYDSEGKYISYNQGKTDEWYETRLATEDNGYGGYGTYFETVTYIIPNIRIALNNLTLVSTDPNYQEPVTAVEYDWELYGIVQLQAQIKNLTNQFDILKKYYGEDWPDVETPEAAQMMGAHAWNKEYYQKQKQEYDRLYDEIGPNGSAYTFLDALYLKRDGTDREGNPISDEAVRNSLKGQLDAVLALEAPYKAYYDLEEYFTEEDLDQIYPLLMDTDYANSNIQLQETDTAMTQIDVEQELLDDCIDKVSELSRPQFAFSSELDNLYRIDAFKDYVGQLRLLNYIHLAVRDDYIVKLRVVGISWNPCDIDSHLTIEFSNMITSRSGRTDFTDILNSENNRGQKNSISIGANGKIAGSGDSIDYLTNLMQALSGTGVFKKNVKNVVSNPVTGVADNVGQEDFIFALKTVPGMSRFVLDSAQAAELDSGDTIMEGGKIKTGFINAKYIAVDQISSPMFNDDAQSVYSLKGMRINLNAPRFNSDTNQTEYVGTIKAPNFAIDEEGDAYFRGDISASDITGGTISGATVIGSIIKNDEINPTFEVTSGGKITSKNAAGTSQTTIEGGLITTNNVNITSKSGDGTKATTINGGQISTNNLSANGGSIAGWNITESSISKTNSQNNTITLANGTNGTQDVFVVKSANNTYPFYLRADGTLVATKGTIGGCNIENGVLKVGSANITSLNANVINSGTISADKINGGTISASAINLNNGTFNVTTTGALTATNADIKGVINATDIIAKNTVKLYRSTQSVTRVALDYRQDGYQQGTINTLGQTLVINPNKAFGSAVVGSKLYIVGAIEASGNIATYGSVNAVNVYSDSSIYASAFHTESPPSSSSSANCRITTGDNSGWLAKITGSSIRYKTLVRELNNSDIEELFNVPLFYFKYRDEYIDKKDERYNIAIPGFIAEQINKVAPIAVDHDENGIPEMWNNNIVTPLMFQMIKSNRSEIDVLKDRISELEKEIQELKDDRR